MTIDVTEAHIAAGRPDDCYSCAVALALNEATGERWQVHGDCIMRWDGLIRLAVETPAAVEAFVTRFDRGESVGPFRFEFVPPIAETA